MDDEPQIRLESERVSEHHNSPQWAAPDDGPGNSGSGATPPVPPVAPANAPTAPLSAAPALPGAQHGYTRGPSPWTPPPVGIIPLRPLSFGSLLGKPFQVLRRNPAPTLGAALIVLALPTVLSIIATGWASSVTADRLNRASQEAFLVLASGGLGVMVVIAFVGIATSLLSTIIIDGLMSGEVAHATLGRRLRWRELWSTLRGRWAALILWAVIASAAVTIVGVIIAWLVVLFLSSLQLELLGLILLGFLAAFVLVGLASLIMTKFAFVSSTIAVERVGPVTAISRSWSLTRGVLFWKTLGVRLLVAMIVSAVAQVIVIPVSVIAGIVLALVAPTGDMDTVAGGTVAISIFAGALGLIVSTVTAVIQGGSTGLLYIDARMRREGLDVTLQGYADQLMRGVQPGTDPFAGPRTTTR